MIIVKRGYTLAEHEPTTYNYRYQSVPSPISRTSIYPLDEYDPPDVLPKATTDTGFPVYLASQLTAEQVGNNEEIDCYLSWRTSSGGNGYHEVIKSVPYTSDTYEVQMIDRDNRYATGFGIISDVPITFEFIADSITMRLTGTRQYLYVAEGVKIACKWSRNGSTNIRNLNIFGNQYYNSIRLSQTGRHTQQEYLYTITGGIVGG